MEAAVGVPFGDGFLLGQEGFGPVDDPLVLHLLPHFRCFPAGVPEALGLGHGDLQGGEEEAFLHGFDQVAGDADAVGLFDKLPVPEGG